jgi:hypothetical protein
VPAEASRTGQDAGTRRRLTMRNWNAILARRRGQTEGGIEPVRPPHGISSATQVRETGPLVES